MPDDFSAIAEMLADALRVQPEGLDADDSAKLCGISRTAWYAFDKRGLVPESVQIGDGPRRWLRSELLAWLKAGAPSRLVWRGMRANALRKSA